MAPKMHLLQCQRVSRSQESRGRGREATEAPSPPPPSRSPPPTTPTSRSPHPARSVSDKNILFSHVVDMDFLDSEGFEIANLIRVMG